LISATSASYKRLAVQPHPENRDYSFTTHFPADPSVERATYQARGGRSLPERIFSVKQNTGTFKVTVVEMPGEETDSDGDRKAKLRRSVWWSWEGSNQQSSDYEAIL
jgi:hypothetical protein